MYLRYILCWFVLIVCRSLAIISESHTTKPPRRLQIQEGSVLLAVNPSNITSAKPENREAIHKPRPPLIVHPGKAKHSSSIETTTTTTTTTPRPSKLTTSISKPKIAPGYDSDGCIIAVDVPSVIDISRSSSLAGQSSPVISSSPKAGIQISTIKGTTTVAPTTRAFRLLCPNPDGFFPYENDCSKFINCWKGRPHIQNCAPGTLFNAATSQCDHAPAVSCKSAAITVPKVEVQPSLDLLCPRANGYFPYENDCSKYVNCWNGRPYIQSCAAGTLFNPVISQCDHASAVTCKAGSVDPRGANSTISPTLHCPKPNGLFPYDSDCSKFVNCWKGRPHVQSCAPGTLFNSLTLECDHASKVTCRVKKPATVPPADNSRQNSSSAVTLTAPLAPDSGQRIRLRGGEGPWEGYLEVREEYSQEWGYVCDSLGDWSVQDANVVCRSLGFHRGAKKPIQGVELGPLMLDRVILNKIECNGTEQSIRGCQVFIGSDCMLHQQVVGVRCFHDPQRLCGEGEYSNGNSCYKLMKPVRLTRDEARTLCEQEGGHLLSIYTQTENDFVTNLMLEKAPSVHTIHTDGVAVRVLRKVLFVWEHNEMAFNFTKWWPNWNKTITGNPDLTSKTECVVLRKRFPYQNGCATLPYFYWTLASCSEGAVAVCKKKQRDIGCIVSNGADYQGTANISQSGLPCLSWGDPRIRHVLVTLSRAAVAFQENPSTNRNRSAALSGSPTHNYCRNPHGENQPWCFVSPFEMEYCDIPKCHIPGRGVLLDTSTQCKVNQYKCTSSECIPNTWVCDGAKDCESGSDEAHCLQYLGEFTDRHNHSLHRHDVEKWMHTTLDTCARRCAEAKEFTCMSFNYNYGQEECILNDSNVGLSGDIVSTPGWIYYERRAYTVNCENDFECPSGKCVNQTMVCDGKNDCGDKSDEVVCYSQLDFQIRLAGSNKSNEGRVEVKVFGQWGAVCDDQFGLNDANVICRQLGFHLGASQALSHSAFGPGSPLLMDDLDCRGNETTLADCPFAGWGVHNCKPEETAGVRCIMAGAECSENQWQCESTGACIAIEFLCDTVDDCGDLSDENRTRCQSELVVRLADGDDLHSGRVEIRHNGIWGTICDDDFGPEDAIVICRMLGFAGPVQVVRETFGAGRGPIWLDEVGCSGTESTLLECSRLPWAKHNCHHSEDVGVRCTAKPSIQVSQIQNSTSNAILPRGKLPEVCGRRIVDDNPMDPLEQAAVAKIVKGEPTKPGAYPWQVGIRVKGSGRSDSVHWCGASVISEHYILTAAHCLEDFPKGLYVLRVGDYNTEDTDAEEDEFSIDRMWFHEDFNMGAHLNNDIALIRIKTKGNRGIKFGSYIQPLCLPPANASYIAGMNCTIAGWGSSGQPGSTFAIKLQAATVPLLQDNVCMAPYVYGVERIKSGMLCAGFLEGGVDACQGDSGGSLVCLVNGRPTLMGITSWGFGCGRPNRPGVYTRVTNYLTWIYSKMAIND